MIWAPRSEDNRIFDFAYLCTWSLITMNVSDYIYHSYACDLKYFNFIQKEVTLIYTVYMGTRFFSQKVNLPAYKIRAALKMDIICSIIPVEVSEFIKEDIQNFVTSFGFKDDDVYKKLEFVSINTRKKYFVFVPPFQVSPSKVTKRAFVSWGLEFIEASPIRLHKCTVPSHKDHIHLYPFFATNDQLLIKYEELIHEDNDDSDLSNDYAALKSIHDDKVRYTNTKFHCSGPAFKPNTRQYKESDWAMRLFHSIRDKLPSNITTEDSCRYRGG